MQYSIRDTGGVESLLSNGDEKSIMLAGGGALIPLRDKIPFRGNFAAGHALLRKSLMGNSL